MPDRLSLRIALLIAIIVPLNFFLFININFVAVRLLGVPDTPVSNAIQVGLLLISTPLLIGMLAARYVTRPLRRFVDAIDAVQHGRAPTLLQPSGIHEFDRVFAAFNGLSTRLASEERLRKSLVSDTSHEFNTPLAAMLAQLAAIEDGVLPPTTERVRGLRHQTERLVDLVAQLDAYTNARLPGTFDDVAAVALHDLCTRLHRMWKPLLDQHAMRLRVAVAPTTTVRADGRALERILDNLVMNALHYSHGTTITIAADAATLVVSDDGRGVHDEHLPLLFERFYRVDPSRNREHGGLGLGLAIVRELAARHGWTVRAENQRPGLKVVLTLSGDA